MNKKCYDTGELYDEDAYTDFMTSTAIRQRVYGYISNLPKESREPAREKVKMLYKMGISWKGIRLAIMGGKNESKD